MDSEETLRFALQFIPMVSVVPEDHSWASYVVLAFVAFNVIDFAVQTGVYTRVFAHLVLKGDGVVFSMLITTIFIALRAITGYLILLLIPKKIIWDWDFSDVVPETVLAIVGYSALGIFVISSVISCFSCLVLLFRGDVKAERASTKDQDAEEKAVPLPTVIILMPVYNEDPTALCTAVDSVIACDYPQAKKHFFISFDDPSDSDLYRRLIKHLAIHASPASPNNGCDYVVQGVKVTVNRFPHGGKRETQAKSYAIISCLYEKDEDARILFIDSDIVLHPHAIHNFVTQQPNAIATTGLITCRTSQEFNILQYLQDAEYLNDQVFIRSTEVLLGAATCLPGALTMTSLATLRSVADTYFGDLDIEKSVDFHRLHLGEDRFLTYLLLQGTEGREYIGFEPSAQCKTEAPGTFQSLLKQRRRWHLGTCTNDIAMLVSKKIWARFPWVMMYKFFAYSTAGVSLLTWAVCCIYITAMGKAEMAFNDLFFYVAMSILCLRFVLNAAVALQLHRRKVVLFSIIFGFFNPVFVALVVVYCVYTWSVRSWGGPRSKKEEAEQPVGVTTKQ